jgi:hypothetical protein
VEDVDVVGVANGVVSVRDQQHRAAGVEGLDAAEQVVFGAGVQRRGGLVEDDQRRVADERPRQSEPLPLADGQVAAAGVPVTSVRRIVAVVALASRGPVRVAASRGKFGECGGHPLGRRGVDADFVVAESKILYEGVPAMHTCAVRSVHNPTHRSQPCLSRL